jgi:hypothetical protein
MQRERHLNIGNQVACEGIEPWFLKNLYLLQRKLPKKKTTQTRTQEKIKSS